MGARLRYLGSLAVAAAGWATADFPSAYAGSCSARIGISSYSSSNCRVVEDERETAVEWAGAGNRVQRFLLQHDGSDEAETFWNGLAAQGDPHEAVGLLRREGRCWRGDDVELCFESPGDDDPAEMIARGAGRTDFGGAIEALGQAEALTCMHTSADAMPPDMRFAGRVAAGQNYSGDVPREYQFTRTSSGNVTLNGAPVEVLYDDGSSVSFRANQRSSMGRLHGGFPAETQRQWDEAREFVDNLVGGLEQSMGIDNRLYLLNFAARTGYLVTLSTETSLFEDAQRIDCW